MKMKFQFKETREYMHTVNVDLDSDQEDAYNKFADELAEDMERHGWAYDPQTIASKFAEKFGDENVEFNEDISPECFYEVY